MFCWKNVSSFCSAKATHIFSAKNIKILCIESAKTVNEMTLNELVKLTTLWTTGPWIPPPPGFEPRTSWSKVGRANHLATQKLHHVRDRSNYWYSLNLTDISVRMGPFPAGTWRKYNVASTSMQRHDIASTLRRCCIYVMCLPGYIFSWYNIVHLIHSFGVNKVEYHITE